MDEIKKIKVKINPPIGEYPEEGKRREWFVVNDSKKYGYSGIVHG